MKISHKVKYVSPLPKYKLYVKFSDGNPKLYDIRELSEKISAYKSLLGNKEIIRSVRVDKSG